MPVERIEYIIHEDGTVEEKVEGVIGPRCEQLTEAFEERLGEVVERVHTPEYVMRPTPRPQRAAQVEKAREEQIDG